MPDFGRSAIFARRRCSEPAFISPSLGALVHRPPRRGPAKNHARLRFNSTGVDSPNIRTSSTRQNVMQHRDCTRLPNIKTQTCAHFGAEAAARLPHHRLAGHLELDVMRKLGGSPGNVHVGSDSATERGAHRAGYAHLPPAPPISGPTSLILHA